MCHDNMQTGGINLPDCRKGGSNAGYRDYEENTSACLHPDLVIS